MRYEGQMAPGPDQVGAGLFQSLPEGQECLLLVGSVRLEDVVVLTLHSSFFFRGGRRRRVVGAARPGGPLSGLVVEPFLG